MAIKIDPCILPNLHIELEAAGPEGDKRVWLFGSFDMWGARFHIECYRLKTVTLTSTERRQVIDTQRGGSHGIAYDDWYRDLTKLVKAHNPDGGFQTVDIDGSDYAVFIYPSSAS